MAVRSSLGQFINNKNIYKNISLTLRQSSCVKNMIINMLIFFLAPYIQPCALKDTKFSQCVKQQIENSLEKFTKGIPEMGVPSIDPVELDNIYIDGNGLNLSFTEPAMHGLSKSKLTDLQ